MKLLLTMTKNEEDIKFSFGHISAIFKATTRHKKGKFSERSGYNFGNYTFYAKSDGLRVISPES